MRELLIIKPNSPLLRKIKLYKRRAKEIKNNLSQLPTDWGRYQSELTQEVNGIFRDMLMYEKDNSINGNTEKIFKFKKFFRERLQKEFSYGDFIIWSQRKPYGYAGDFRIMYNIYENSPTTLGFDRLFDNYMQMSAISIAVRNRKNDFIKLIKDVLGKKPEEKINILNLACGPCREIEELYSVNSQAIDNTDVTFDCLDADKNALDFARKTLAGKVKSNFLRYNIIRLALDKNIDMKFGKRYDLIYSTGLFDYLGEEISIKLIKNLKRLLKPNAILAISDVCDKFSNPSLHFMELVGEWNLIYRSIDDFRNIFLRAGFKKEYLRCDFEQQGIMQYIVAKNSN